MFLICFVLFLQNIACNMLIKKDNYQEYTNQTLYIEDTFTQDEIAYIYAASLEWSKATDNRVKYNLVVLRPGIIVELGNSLVINKVSASNADVIVLDYLFNKDNPPNTSIKTLALGYYYDSKVLPSIILVSERLDDFNYKSVVMHELGHSLGLSHNEEKENIFNSIMFPSLEGQSNEITDVDVKQYCKIHHCK
jgi:hypothetical protein